MTDRPKTPANDRRLADIVREVKIATADRTDVVIDMRDADRARLELLAEELQPVLAGIDPSDDRFDFGLTQGLQPRLWIDAVAHVHMGHDRRVFRFVRDTRLGRKIISDTSDMAATADAVSHYIAERVIERERILAGDFDDFRGKPASGSDGRAKAAADAAMPQLTSSGAAASSADKKPDGPAGMQPPSAALRPETHGPDLPERSGGAGLVLGASWFILGCVAGAAALVVAFWDRLSAMIS